MGISWSSFTMKFNVRFNNKVRLAMAAMALMLVSGAAGAVGTIGDNASQFLTQLGPIADVVMAVFFIGGLVAGGMAAYKFKAHGDNPQQNKITTPIIYAAVAALLIGLPAFLEMSKDSVLGSGAQANGLNGNAYENIQ